jgi:hypothetical protein
MSVPKIGDDDRVDGVADVTIFSSSFSTALGLAKVGNGLRTYRCVTGGEE